MAGKRVFVVDGREFPDPDTAMSIDAVRKSFADFFPELANAEGPTVPTKRGEDEVWEFKRAVGTKG